MCLEFWIKCPQNSTSYPILTSYPSQCVFLQCHEQPHYNCQAWWVMKYPTLSCHEMYQSPIDFGPYLPNLVQNKKQKHISKVFTCVIPQVQHSTSEQLRLVFQVITYKVQRIANIECCKDFHYSYLQVSSGLASTLSQLGGISTWAFLTSFRFFPKNLS